MRAAPVASPVSSVCVRVLQQRNCRRLLFEFHLSSPPLIPRLGGNFGEPSRWIESSAVSFPRFENKLWEFSGFSMNFS